MPPSAAPPLSVQTVVYQHTRGELERFLGGLGAAVALARRSRAVGEVTVAVGDCSPQPAVSTAATETIREHLAATGVGTFDYRFFDENLGSAGGHNALAQEFGGELILIVNPDAYVMPDVLIALIERAAPDVGVVEARQIPLEHPKSFDHRTGETSWASTACALVDGQLMADIGGFDQKSFFLYCDDVDFSWRARLHGRRVIYEPRARIFHDKRLDPAGQVLAGEAEVYYSAEAALMMAWKYSRQDLVEQWSAGLEATGVAAHARAVETFAKRRVDGQLPEQLDAAGEVSQFVGYAYARHRFGYDDA